MVASSRPSTTKANCFFTRDIIFSPLTQTGLLLQTSVGM
jgi:hypothetical protein